MGNPEKLATYLMQDVDKQSKNTTQYVLDTTMCKTNTNNVSKALAFLQTTAGKDEPNISFFVEIVTEITTRHSERKNTY